MASNDLGFLALPQFLKGTPELSILPSLPPSDPFAGNRGWGACSCVGRQTSGVGGAGLGGGWGGPAGSDAGLGGAW